MLTLYTPLVLAVFVFTAAIYMQHGAYVGEILARNLAVLITIVSR